MANFVFDELNREILQDSVPCSSSSITFSDFPDDVQLCILSFLTPSELASFSCTAKRFVSLCRSDSKIWFSMCDRKWGSNTKIGKWGNGRIGFKVLYKALSQWENLIGFWRLTGPGTAVISSPPLVVFEWGTSFLTGSRVSPSKNGTYQVIKVPFLWMSLSLQGEVVCFLDPDCQFESSEDFARAAESTGTDLVPISISFMGKSHIIVEEDQSSLFTSYSPEGRKVGFRRSSSSSNLRQDDQGIMEDVIGVESTSPGSLPDNLMSEIYQYFANRTSPSGDRASRRQRKKEKARQGRHKWESEHFVRIVNCNPTPSRPLQGLWKGICDDMSIDFYLVAYEENGGGIVCRRVGDTSKPFSGYSPVFWTSDTTFLEPPFSSEEENLYDCRIHLRPCAAVNDNQGYPPFIENEEVSRILHINSSYDLVIPDSAESSTNTWSVEGRIWQYNNGTFGFGFLRNNFIIDLKHIALNGCLLDTKL